MEYTKQEIVRNLTHATVVASVLCSVWSELSTQSLLAYVHIVFIKLCTNMSQVSFPDPTTHARKGSGDIRADSWFCKLNNHVTICIDLYWHM